MYSDHELRQLVNQSITELEPGKEPEGLYDPISYSLSVGGKRVRPVLCLLSYQLYNERMDPSVLMPALGLEVFHGFTLLHDDIIDKADIRRGQPTVHKKWGTNAAILSGDAMCIEAYRLVSQCNATYIPKILGVFNKTAAQVCEGQQLDINFESSPVITEEEYLNMIELKTAVLLAASAKIGGLAAGASSGDCDWLYRFGLPLGLAFQIQDDILDTFGDPKIFGKAIGGDIATNKKTYLLITALKLAQGDDLKSINAILKDKEMDKDERYAKMRALYDKLNVKQHADKKVNELLAEAIKNLNNVTGNKNRKDEVIAFAENLVDRKM
ncbi:MAG: polyprenyl synthetase family protein [Prevotellaceae bacterium]|jgi:geranylgeranyl diphosphate synthase type II|nr:polyprenyl synthetase family protein [Prevotellaceae bacterium]